MHGSRWTVRSAGQCRDHLLVARGRLCRCAGAPVDLLRVQQDISPVTLDAAQMSTCVKPIVLIFNVIRGVYPTNHQGAIPPTSSFPLPFPFPLPLPSPLLLSPSPPLHTPPLRTNFSRQAFRHAASTVWNEIPLTILESGTINTFKRRLESHLFNIYSYYPATGDCPRLRFELCAQITFD